MKFLIVLSVVLLHTVSFSQPIERIWVTIEDAPEITTYNASSFESYENTVESVLNYFYASQIRKDMEWMNVFVPHADWDERIAKKLIKYDQWTITNFHMVSKSEYAPGKFYVKVYFKIEVDGKSEDGIDTAEVQLIDGKWIITSIPT